MSLRSFYQDPYYQIKAFARNTIFVIALCVSLFAMRSSSFFEYQFAVWHLALILPGIYIGGISAVFIHNATHKSFSNRLLNELCGELAGLHQLWGFTGWRLIHLVHHQYSDNVENDPHPTKNRKFWEYTAKMFVNSSLTISRRYREHWGTNSRTQQLQLVTVGALASLAITSLLFWFLLLGPAGFIWFYIPSLIVNHLLFAQINYFCHPLNEKTGETEAANLNHNLYYKFANLIWCGIFFHGNHHRRATLFNPRYMNA